MPQIENVWLPSQAARKVDLTSAPVGSLMYEFDGDPLIVKCGQLELGDRRRQEQSSILRPSKVG